MDPTMQQAISDNNTEINNDVNGLAQEMENVSVNNGSAAEDAPVPTYDQQFPTLGGGAGQASQPTTPFGQWNAKPRVQSSTITQVKQSTNILLCSALSAIRIINFIFWKHLLHTCIIIHW